MWNSLKGIIGETLPAVASVIGTPLAGKAVKGLCDVLGLKSDATEGDVAKAIASATPEQLIAMRQLDTQYAIRLEELAMADIADARNREVRMQESGKKDWTQSILALCVTFGFFGLLGLLVRADVDKEAMDILKVMTGVLGMAFASVIGYYFGSSSSSREKDSTISKMAGK